jgi:hypothetical protein
LILKIWKFFNYANLDVSLGAFCAALTAQKYLHVQLHWTFFWLLSSAIWMVYTLDRLLDIRKTKPILTPRHHFHSTFQSILQVILCFLFGINIYLALFAAPLDLLIFGLGMVIFSGLHLVLVHQLQHIKSFWVMKEPAIALAYTLGIWAYPALQQKQIFPEQVFIIVLFFQLALGNLMMLAILEENIDKESGFNSWIQNIGTQTAEKWLDLILISGLLASLMLIFVNFYWALALLAGYGTHVIVWLNKSRYYVDEKYRRWTEISFVYPIIYWLLA